MREIIRLCRAALFLDTGAFVKLKNSDNVFEKAVLLIVVLGLVVGLVGTAAGFMQEESAVSSEARLSEPQPADERASEIVGLLGDRIDAETGAMLRNYIKSSREAGARIAQTAAPAHTATQDLLEAVGKIASYPFGWLAIWLLYGLVVLLAAKILRGRATVQQMLGCTALAATPFILLLFGIIPQLGSWPESIAFVWGLVIYVKVSAVANEFGIGKAVLAVILFILVIPLVGPARLLDAVLPRPVSPPSTVP